MLKRLWNLLKRSEPASGAPVRVQPIGSALAKAIRLHDFIRSTTGETADWPIQISSSDHLALQRLDELLRDFKAAVDQTPNNQAHA